MRRWTEPDDTSGPSSWGLWPITSRIQAKLSARVDAEGGLCCRASGQHPHVGGHKMHILLANTPTFHTRYRR
jgi:hypothetical protein